MKLVWPEIADSLRQEVAEYGALLRLYEDQQQQLFARNSDAVLRLSAEIELQVRSLHERRRLREDLIATFAQQNGQPADATLRSLFPYLAAEVRPLFSALISEVNVLIHRIRRTSRHNHLLLARAVEIHQQLLRQILPDAFTQTYASSGRVAVSSVALPVPALRAAG
jgi:flagellar biosynthesis/type III secretory pathway chaperone